MVSLATYEELENIEKAVALGSIWYDPETDKYYYGSGPGHLGKGTPVDMIFDEGPSLSAGKKADATASYYANWGHG